jgi:hypothetical protein
MGGDFYPLADAAFGPWYNKLVNACVEHQSELELTNAEVGALTSGLAAWQSDYLALVAARADLEAALSRKRSSRKAQNRLVRRLNAKLQANPEVSATLKAALGLPVRDTIGTRAAEPTTAPLLVVNISQRLHHTLSFRDQSTPGRRAKPKGVREIHIWAKVGSPAPAGVSDCRFVASASKSPLQIPYPGADAGKTVHYLGRWRNAHGEFGPWSETVEATIGA